MDYENIIFRDNGEGIFSIILNRPNKRNAISPQMIDNLNDVVSEINANADLRLIKLEGEGDIFCSGGDLDWMRKQVNSSRDHRIKEAMKLAKMFRAINSLSRPLLGVIKGDAFGGGLGLISICDYCICSSEAKFGLTETRLGLIPSTISPYVIAKVGEGNSRDIFLSGEIFDAYKAQKIGLINELAEPSEMEKSVEKYVEFFKSTSKQAVSASKALIQTLRPSLSDEVIKETAVRLANAWETNDAKKGIEGFLKKARVAW